MVIRQGLQNRLLDSKPEGLAGTWGFAYPVYPVHLERPVRFPQLLATGGTPGHPNDRRPTFPWAHDPLGVFVVDGLGGSGELTPLRRYDPTREADTILTAVTALDPTDDAALLRFVNTWGLLRIAEPNRDPVFDSVTMTRTELAEVARLARWLQAMKARHWMAPPLPPMDEIRRVVPGIPERPSPTGRRRAYWLAYVNRLNRALARYPVKLQLQPHGSGVERAVRPRGLVDVLYITLWRYASEDETVLRGCEGCGGLYAVSRTNRKRRYCSPRCKNRTGVRRWRARIQRSVRSSRSPGKSTRRTEAQLVRSESEPNGEGMPVPLGPAGPPT